MQSSVAYVIMPFSTTPTHSQEEWQNIFENVFKPTFTLFGFECIRSDVKSGSILQNIIQRLHESSVIFADLTDSKPNVLYELGVAHTITRNVIMASQKIDDCPSDLKPYGVILYKSNPTHADTIRFQNDLKESMQKIGNENIETSPVHQFTGRTMLSLEEVLRNPIAIMRCAKCSKQYEVNLNETTQSDYGVDAEAKGRRTHPFGIEHQRKGLCGHWECAQFIGLKNSV